MSSNDEGYALTPQQISDAFMKLDTNASGLIGMVELTEAMVAQGVCNDPNVIRQMAADAGAKNNQLNFKQFSELLSSDEARLGKPPSFFEKPVVKYIIMFISLVVACYTVVVAWRVGVESSRSTYAMKSEPPDDRCISFFDTVQTWQQANENTTDVLYDYVKDRAFVRVCSDLPDEEVIRAIGADKQYFPFRWKMEQSDVINASSSTTCDVADSATFARVVENCSPQPACQQSVREEPIPFGVHWRHQVEANSISNASSPGEFNCSFTVTEIPGIQPCNRRTVLSFHDEPSTVFALIASVASLTPLLSLIAQVVLWIIGMCMGVQNARNCFRRSLWWALQGATGPFIYIIASCQEEGKRAALDRLSATTFQWVLLVIQDFLEGVVIPVCALWGCPTHLWASRHPFIVALMGIKIAIIVGRGILYWITRKESAVLALATLAESLAPAPTTSMPPQQQYAPVGNSQTAV